MHFDTQDVEVQPDSPKAPRPLRPLRELRDEFEERWLAFLEAEQALERAVKDREAKREAFLAILPGSSSSSAERHAA